MACNHTYRDYTKMTVEEMVSYIAQDGKIQSTVTAHWLAPCAARSSATRRSKHASRHIRPVHTGFARRADVTASALLVVCGGRCTCWHVVPCATSDFE